LREVLEELIFPSKVARIHNSAARIKPRRYVKYTRKSRHVLDKVRNGVVVTPRINACKRYGEIICGREKRKYIVLSPTVI
jgi:hypothetical protein